MEWTKGESLSTRHCSCCRRMIFTAICVPRTIDLQTHVNLKNKAFSCQFGSPLYPFYCEGNLVLVNRVFCVLSINNQSIQASN